jgi:hypothetical protein
MFFQIFNYGYVPGYTTLFMFMYLFVSIRSKLLKSQNNRRQIL